MEEACGRASGLCRSPRGAADFFARSPSCRRRLARRFCRCSVGDRRSHPRGRPLAAVGSLKATAQEVHPILAVFCDTTLPGAAAGTGLRPHFTGLMLRQPLHDAGPDGVRSFAEGRLRHDDRTGGTRGRSSGMEVLVRIGFRRDSAGSDGVSSAVRLRPPQLPGIQIHLRRLPLRARRQRNGRRYFDDCAYGGHRDRSHCRVF